VGIQTFPAPGVWTEVKRLRVGLNGSD
jgi:hypothetical protein